MIKQAAIKWENRVYTVVRPGRHDTVFALMAKENPEHTGPFLGDEQGFITERGAFVDRETAADIALRCEQVIDPTTREILNPQELNWPPNLYSEDLW